MEIDCRGCELPELWAANRLAWELWKVVAEMGDGLVVDVGRLLERYEVEQPFAVLRKLAVIQGAARANRRGRHGE